MHSRSRPTLCASLPWSNRFWGLSVGKLKGFLAGCLLASLFVTAVWADSRKGPGKLLEPDVSGLSKSLNTSEVSVFGRKYPEMPSEKRLQQLEQAVGNAPPPKASPEYRMSQILDARQSMVSPEQKAIAVHLYNKGVDDAGKGNTDAAIAAYRSALAVDPYLIPAYNNLASLQENQERFSDATETYQQALALSPDEPLLHFNLAVVLEKQGKIVEAYDHYRQYVLLSPEPSPHIVELVRNFDARHITGKKAPDYYRLATAESHGERLVWRARQMPIPVYIHLTDLTQAVFVDCIHRDFDAWTRVTQGVLRFREVGRPENARIVITLSPAPLMDPEASVGHASFNSEVLGGEDPMRALKVNIVVNTGEPRMRMSLEGRKAHVERLTLHELGHAIGIWGHSADPDDIMYTHPIVSHLSQRDINTVRRLYGMPVSSASLP